MMLASWAPVPQVPADRSFERERPAGFCAGEAGGRRGAAEDVQDDRGQRSGASGGPKPPSFWAVVDEGVLRRRIGSAKVMHDQLVHLAEMAERPMIKIHVVPAEVGAHIGLLGAFAIAGFADDAPGIVYFERPTRERRRETLPRWRRSPSRSIR